MVSMFLRRDTGIAKRVCAYCDAVTANHDVITDDRDVKGDDRKARKLLMAWSSLAIKRSAMKTTRKSVTTSWEALIA